MIVSGVGKRYARALFELAHEQHCIVQAGQALGDVARAFETSAELRTVLEDPKPLPEVKRELIAAIGTRVGAPTFVVNALRVLSDRGRLVHLGSVAAAFDALAEKQAGTLRAEVTSAAPLSEAYFVELGKALSESTGRKVSLVRHIDPSLVGGVVVRIGDTVYDGSIKNRLSDIRHQMMVAASPHGRA